MLAKRIELRLSFQGERSLMISVVAILIALIILVALDSRDPAERDR